ncbi:dynactin subunit 2 [Apis mellifera caucasica]|uniref:Dynactin subunit 2 n=1 Tax=Apis mellifera TaxID=7460 RepID=A0A7M7TFG5_APIME|nr:dynactin subunit 2 [Apis mellifera]KAG6795671.1 dynactin subunit 2 [Apis mellifera caucasica]KAG9433020.1 dynactin subunit 2 [Apis mellifera carnica]|eukprot:XP_395729.3 dynactin subunit 2 [Apis mellifera]
MADPKYADLPGIAYDQVDVYETTDLPESEQFQLYPEDETDSIEKLHISATEAFNKFKNKHVISKGVDFSDRVSLKPRTGYKFGDWELPGEGEKETLIQKYQRLQCEIKELYEEVNDLKEKMGEDEVKSVAGVISQVQLLEKQLDSLKLEECLGADLVATLSDPQGTRMKQLISQIEAFKQTSILTSDTDSKMQNIKDDKTNKTEPGVLKYQMMYLPEKARMQEAARIALLEQRLCNLESIIGTTSDKLSKFSQNLKSQGVMEALQELGAKAALLDTYQLDIIESRLATLIHRMDNIAQKKTTLTLDSEQEQKISEMYDIMKQTETMSQILPQTVNRMLALNTIHQQAATFNKSLTRLEELQSQITSDLESNKSLLKGVQESFASNLEIIKNNIESLDERIKKLNK